MKRKTLTPQQVAVAALMIALTTVFTKLIQIPIPATGGYINLSDVAITFAGLAFGPWVGFLAGGVGAALADLLSGYAQFAPLTFVAHGVEGLIIGYLGYNRGLREAVIGWLVGGAFMVLAYYVGEATIMGMGWVAPLQEIPGNLIQMLAGGVVGIPLVMAVRRAYPPIAHLGTPPTWHD
ncbi:MAG: ECF transporter S component [Chloroflexi bacterium]|nr:ECF transporter S component [Chloroflexota bacterium]